MYLIFALNLLVVVFASFSIALLLPLIEIIDSGGEPVPESANRVALLMHQIVDFFGFGGSVPGILLLIAAVYGVKSLVGFVTSVYGMLVSVKLQLSIRQTLLEYYKNMSYAFYSRNNTGHYINIFTNQVYELINSFFTFKNFNVLVIRTVVYISFSFLISWQFTLMAVGCGVVYLIIFRPLNNFVRSMSRKVTQEYSVLNMQLVQTLQGFKYLSATASLDRSSRNVISSLKTLLSFAKRYGVIKSFISAIKEPLSVGLILGIMILQIVVFEAPIAPIIVALILVYRAFGQIMSLQSSWLGVLNHIGPIEMVEREMHKVRHEQVPDGKKQLPPFSGHIELRDISFAYRSFKTKDPKKLPAQTLQNLQLDEEEEPARVPVLHNLSFTIQANTTVAFVGESGSGKSTLIDLMLLLHRPDSGSLFIDGINAADLSLKSWRNQIGYVSQDAVLFDDTVANNICMWAGDPQKDPQLLARIREALKSAHALPFVDDMPEGLHTMIGDRGIRLSGGQKQRLCIARELFKQPRVLFLDEATSALDSESEHIIKQSIDGLRGKLTVIMVAHRLSTIRNADTICVIKNGRIIEHGTFEALIARRGAFARMAGLQKMD